jgi:hypothetical protein
MRVSHQFFLFFNLVFIMFLKYIKTNYSLLNAMFKFIFCQKSASYLKILKISKVTKK